MSPPATIELDAQYRQMREAVGLLDRSDRGKLLVGGGDAAEFLQGQLTNDIESPEEGQGCYAALLDRKGHIQADMRVLRLAEGIWIDTEPVATETVLRHLRTYSIGREVEIADVSSERAILSLIGPGLAGLSGAGWAAALTAVASGPEHSTHPLSENGTDCLAVATDRGVDLLAAEADAAGLREELLAAGAGEVGEAAAEILRVESGRPRFGAEMTLATMPAEAGIVERAVSFSKGCYIGQETVARLHYKGKPNRHLRGLRLEAGVEAGNAVTLDGRELGAVGTACLSPALGPIALAILRREAVPGTSVLVGAVGAVVSDLPFEESL